MTPHSQSRLQGFHGRIERVLAIHSGPLGAPLGQTAATLKHNVFRVAGLAA
jgi:hypothetical protein